MWQLVTKSETHFLNLGAKPWKDQNYVGPSSTAGSKLRSALRKFLHSKSSSRVGERAIYYFAAILNASGKEDFRISLGSYEFTNRIAHETGDLPKDKRLYHLDRYDSAGHATFAFYEFQPTYEQFSAGVQGTLSGTAKPLSSTRSKAQ